MRLLSLTLALLLLLPFSGVGQSSNKRSYTPDETLTYKVTPQRDLTLDIFYPDHQKEGKKRGVIVQFFGGGWASGNTNQFYQQSAFYADHGYVAISVDYRTISRDKTTPFECVEDAKSAIRWVRENAKELGINPKKVVASGGSAGGHLAACTALIEEYDLEGENLKISSVPNALVLFNPVIKTTSDGYGANKLVGKETLISPTHHVKKGVPPTIIFHGTKDTTVPFANAEEFLVEMEKVGNRCIVVPFEGKNHGFFNGSYFRSTNTDEDFNRCMEETLTFLKSNKL